MKNAVTDNLVAHLEGISEEQFAREWAEILVHGVKSPTIDEYLSWSCKLFGKLDAPIGYTFGQEYITFEAPIVSEFFLAHLHYDTSHRSSV